MKGTTLVSPERRGLAGLVVVGALILPAFGMAQHNDRQHSDRLDVCAVYEQAFPLNSVKSVRSGAWSDAQTWGGNVPDPSRNVEILHDVVADQAVANQVLIRGTVELAGTLDVTGSVLVCAGGTLRGNSGTLAFHVADDRLYSGDVNPGPLPEFTAFHPNDIGLWVFPQGTLRLEGEPISSWLDVSKVPGQRSRSLGQGVNATLAFDEHHAYLESPPQGWRQGDQLLLVSEKGESALARLESQVGNEVTYSLDDPDDAGIAGYVLEVESDQKARQIRPKIANLTRRVAIVSADVSEETPNRRAHTAYFEGSQISLRQVEFRNLGPREKLGRYPVHWHHAMQSDGVLENSSIWQSVADGGNRFVTMHMVSGLRIAGNVGYRSQGHGFFMEEKREYGNQIVDNLSVDVWHGEELPNVDASVSQNSHHFWLRENNVITGNVAAGNLWDGSGRGNNWPDVAGLVILPATVPDPQPVVSDFECLGCGGTGMWAAVAGTVFENSISAYALVTGINTYRHLGSAADSIQLRDPLFVFNGGNELFARTRNYRDRIPWVSQIYINYGDLEVQGGTVVGGVGIHTHYNSRVRVEGTTFITGIFIDPTYWESTVEIADSTVDTGQLFGKPYPNRRAAPGIIRLSNSCVSGRCNRERDFEDAAYTGGVFGDMFAGAARRGSPPNSRKIDGVLPVTGFIDVSAVEGARFWSVMPVDSRGEGKITRIRESQGVWEGYFEKFGGFIDGFPPGQYEVKLYSGSKPESLITSTTVTVTPGQVTSL